MAKLIEPLLERVKYAPARDVVALRLSSGLSPHPTGPSADANIWPRRTTLAGFDRDVAHANAYNGLFVDIERNPPGVIGAPNYTPPVVADFTNFTSYKNRRRGAWLRGTRLRLSNATIADNAIGVTFAGADAVLRDSLVIGESDNRTGPPKPFESNFPIRGFEFYDGQVGVERTHFAGFRLTRCARRVRLGPCSIRRSLPTRRTTRCSLHLPTPIVSISDDTPA